MDAEIAIRLVSVHHILPPAIFSPRCDSETQTSIVINPRGSGGLLGDIGIDMASAQLLGRCAWMIEVHDINQCVHIICDN